MTKEGGLFKSVALVEDGGGDVVGDAVGDIVVVVCLR